VAEKLPTAGLSGLVLVGPKQTAFERLRTEHVKQARGRHERLDALSFLIGGVSPAPRCRAMFRCAPARIDISSNEWFSLTTSKYWPGDGQSLRNIDAGRTQPQDTASPIWLGIRKAASAAAH
jgi:hypothetical protein